MVDGLLTQHPFGRPRIWEKDNNKMVQREIVGDSRRLMELVHDPVHWRALVLTLVNILAFLPQ